MLFVSSNKFVISFYFNLLLIMVIVLYFFKFVYLNLEI
jgi:hypothetical protein